MGCQVLLAFADLMSVGLFFAMIGFVQALFVVHAFDAQWHRSLPAWRRRPYATTGLFRQ